MKAFVVVAVCFFVAAQALNEEETKAFNKVNADCVSTTKVDVALVAKLRAGEDVTDEKLKKYVGCMFSKLKLMNEAGEIQAEVIKSKIPSDVKKDEANKIVDECKNTKGKDNDETAFLVYKCMLKKSGKPLITLGEISKDAPKPK